MKGLNWFIARHYLRAGKERGLLSLITWIALGGFTLGVAALIIVTSVVRGMQGEVRSMILESIPHLYVLEYSSTLRLKNSDAVVDSILRLDGVEAASPFAMSSITLVDKSGEYSQPAYLFGVADDPERPPATDIELKMIESGDLEPTESGLSPLIVGTVLADRMQLFTGDTMAVLSMENLNVNVMGLPQPTIRQFEVTGTFRTGMYEYDAANVYTTMEAAQDLLGIPAADASGIGVRTVDADNADEFSAVVADQLGLSYSVESWVTRNQALFGALRLEKIALGLIVFLIVIVAAFNIVSTLVMVVSDRTKEIGILRTMGMTEKNILRIFVLQGAWIGVIGTVVGTTLGVGIAWAIDRFEFIKIPGELYFVDHLPATLDPVEIGIIVAASVSIAFLATIYPAKQASRLQPLDAIRHE